MPGNLVEITPEVIATWPKPNYINPPERQWLPLACGILYAFSTVTVSLRLWLRIMKQAGPLGIDDAMLALSWLGSTMYTICAIVISVSYNVGRHTWDIPIPSFERIALLAWLGELSFLWTGGCVKISVLLFYRRIVAGTYDKRWKWAIIASVAFTASWTVGLIVTLVINCEPTEAYWKAYNPMYTTKYTCIDSVATNLIAGIFAIGSDLYAIALPFIITRHLKVPTKHRIALNLLFSSGLAVVAVSSVRTYYLYQVGHARDVSRMIFNVFFWGQMELQLSILLASLPAVRAFFRRYVGTTFVRSSHNSRSNYTVDAGYRRQNSAFEHGSIYVTKEAEIELESAHTGRSDKTNESTSGQEEVEAKPWTPTSAPQHAYAYGTEAWERQSAAVYEPGQEGYRLGVLPSN